jgi:hypothetical protein
LRRNLLLDFGNVRQCSFSVRITVSRGNLVNAQLYSFVFTVRVLNSSVSGYTIVCCTSEFGVQFGSACVRACGFLEQTHVPIHIHGPIAHMY